MSDLQWAEVYEKQTAAIERLEAELLRAQMRISELEYVIGMLRGDLAS